MHRIQLDNLFFALNYKFFEKKEALKHSKQEGGESKATKFFIYCKNI